MQLHSGRTYKSPFYSREIKVMSILEEQDFYVLAIYWVEPDLPYDEMDQIRVSKYEVDNDWRLVK